MHKTVTPWRPIGVFMLLLAVCLCPASVLADAPATQTQAASAPQTQPTSASEPAAEKPIPISFNNAPMDQIAKFLADQMGKPVLIAPGVKDTKITLVNPTPLPKVEALEILNTALHEYGVAVEERERTVHLIPIAEVAKAQLKTLGPEVDLDEIRPRNQIVRKIFDVRHYDAEKLIEILKPLLPSFGHITAEPTTGKLIVVATVGQLSIMSGIIGELDQPDVSGRELKVFPVHNVDVSELVPVLEKLIAGYLGVEVRSVLSVGGPSGQPQPGPRPGEGQSPGAITVKGEKAPVLLIPDSRRSVIVVAAPSAVLSRVQQWLVDLDQPKPQINLSEIVEVKYSDVEDLVRQLNIMLASHPDEGLRTSVKIFPFVTSRRIMIVGSDQNRQVIKDWLEQIDVADIGIRETRTFKLTYGDASQVAENLKELFQDDSTSRRFRWFTRGGGSDRDQVTVTANTRANTVTIIASPEKMAKIAEQIEELDRPFDGEEAAPRIYTLQYADPEKTRELLENLFTKKESSNDPWWSWGWGDDDETPSPVGRLFGQFSFEAYPETGRLIVVSKNAENYKVIDDMIAEIDKPQDAGVPRVIQLKFADAETLAEQLNALLNAPGTPTSILRRTRQGTFEGFSDLVSPYNPEARKTNQPQEQKDDATLRTMQFWWQNPPHETDIRQPSNLVGKLRIVPNVEQNLLLVAAPEEYADSISRFVEELDKPGYQVLVKAVIAEIVHDDTISLGYRFSSDPTLFTSGDPIITENALRGLLSYEYRDTVGNEHTLALDVNVNNLISLLRRVTDLKIKSEPKILTADNIEAEFFDGQDIPFISVSQFTDVGALNQSFEYFPVGIRLRVRPHISNGKEIDLTVNLSVSSIVPGRTLFGGAIIDRRETTTRVVLEDGKTFLISGILREEQTKVIRRVPGLGDIPILGELFKHRELGAVNSELLIFLTPYVIGPGTTRDVIESEPLKRFEEGMNHPGKISRHRDEPTTRESSL